MWSNDTNICKGPVIDVNVSFGLPSCFSRMCKTSWRRSRELCISAAVAASRGGYTRPSHKSIERITHPPTSTPSPYPEATSVLQCSPKLLIGVNAEIWRPLVLQRVLHPASAIRSLSIVMRRARTGRVSYSHWHARYPSYPHQISVFGTGMR